MWLVIYIAMIASMLIPIAVSGENQFGTPNGEEGTRIFKATEHPNYTGRFHLSGTRTTLVIEWMINRRGIIWTIPGNT